MRDECILKVVVRRVSEWVSERVNQTRSISLQNDIPPCSSSCWISWTVLTPQQCSALQACPHPAPPCLLCYWFLMTKCIETIGWTLPSIRRHSEGSLCGSGPQGFQTANKTAVTCARLAGCNAFQPHRKEAVRASRAEWGGMAAAVCSPSNTLVPHQSRPEFWCFPYQRFIPQASTILYLCLLVWYRLQQKKLNNTLSGCKVYASCLGQIICLYTA